MAVGAGSADADADADGDADADADGDGDGDGVVVAAGCEGAMVAGGGVTAVVALAATEKVGVADGPPT